MTTKYKFLALSLLLLTPLSFLQAQPKNAVTNNKTLNEFIKKHAGKVKGSMGHWEIEFRGVKMTVLTSESYNRMRIITPVAQAQGIKAPILRKMLEANFHKTMDGRYAIWRGQVWAAYLHPLKQLTEAELKAALLQVFNLKQTFGTTYSSGDLIFAGK